MSLFPHLQHQNRKIEHHGTKSERQPVIPCVFREIKPDDLSVILLARQERDRSEAEQHHRTGDNAVFPFDLPVVERIGRHHRHNEDRHIEPAGIVGTVEGVEHRIQHRNERADDADRSQARCPVFALLRHERDHARHGEHRQIAADRRPFAVIRPEQIRSRRHIRQHEEALDDMPDADSVGIGNEIIAVKPRLDPVIIQNGQRGGQQHKGGDHHADHGFQRNAEEFPHIGVEILVRAADDIVDDRKDGLPREEVIVQDAHERDRQREYAAAVLIYPLLHCDQQQRKKCRDIVKMIEENIIELEAGKCIEQRTDKGCGLAPDKAPDIGIGGQCGNGVLESEQIRDHIQHPFLRERDRQPEERTAQQIE